MCFDEKICSGCLACEKICPANCIKIIETGKKKFKQNNDLKRCMGCNLCNMVCPHINKSINVDSIPPKGYNAWAKKKSVLRRSSSGGIASIIYDYCIKNSISCIGVQFDEEYNLKYKFLLTQSDIRRSAGSKYVYSRMGDIYNQVKKVIESGKKVVFIGLPCHVAALRNYCSLSNTDLENLITVDIVCHGIIMPYFFDKHISRIIDKRESKKKSILFRSKQNQYGITILEKGEEIYKKTRYSDEYMLLFQNNILAESCYSCSYANRIRVGDITIKDCSTKWYKRKGQEIPNQSSVIVNTKKGNLLWENLSLGWVDSYAYSFDAICAEDQLLNSPVDKPTEYRLFFALEHILEYKMTATLLWKRKNIIKQLLEFIRMG